MLTIRLRRKGKKNQPFFRVIVIDKRKTAKGGNAVEIVGSIDPLTKKKHFKKDRVLYWISKGAKPSASVHNLLVSEKIIEAKKINVSKISKKKQAEIDAKKSEETKVVAEPAPVETKAEEKPAEVEKPAEQPPAETPVETPKEPEVKPEEKLVEAVKGSPGA